MGISGLLTFLRSACAPADIKNYKGSTVAIDAYSWLHKGAFSCADKIVKGEKTDGYIHYCMKMLNMLVNAGVKPIMVFDGCNLVSKAVTEKKRQEYREKIRQKAKDFLIQGKLKEAQECFQRCVDITPEMAYEVIEACRLKNIDCIVAPYEADAQLAYLAKANLAQIIITEDSDLILFGCDKILFKMDSCGGGLLYRREDLPKVFGPKAERMSFEKFRYMCILSGCDYLPSLPGIGLAKSFKFFSLTVNLDLNTTLPNVPRYLKMPKIVVTPDYISSFIKANNTFLYQLVFCPRQKMLIPLNSYPEGIDPAEMEYAGKYVANDLALEIAKGNINVKTMQRFDDNSIPTCKQWTNNQNSWKSIWDSDMEPCVNEEVVNKPAGSAFVFKQPRTPQKKRTSLQMSGAPDDLAEEDAALLAAYSFQKVPSKGLRTPVIEDGNCIAKENLCRTEIPKRKIFSPFRKTLTSNSMNSMSSVDDFVWELETPPKKAKLLDADSTENIVTEKITSGIPMPKKASSFRQVLTSDSRNDKGLPVQTVVKSRFFVNPFKKQMPVSGDTRSKKSWLDSIESEYDEAIKHDDMESETKKPPIGTAVVKEAQHSSLQASNQFSISKPDSNCAKNTTTKLSSKKSQCKSPVYAYDNMDSDMDEPESCSLLADYKGENNANDEDDILNYLSFDLDEADESSCFIGSQKSSDSGIVNESRNSNSLSYEMLCSEVQETPMDIGDCSVTGESKINGFPTFDQLCSEVQETPMDLLHGADLEVLESYSFTLTNSISESSSFNDSGIVSESIISPNDCNFKVPNKTRESLESALSEQHESYCFDLTDSPKKCEETRTSVYFSKSPQTSENNKARTPKSKNSKFGACRTPGLSKKKPSKHQKQDTLFNFKFTKHVLIH